MLYDYSFNSIFYKLCKLKIDYDESSYLPNGWDYEDHNSMFISNTIRFSYLDHLGITSIRLSNVHSYSLSSKTLFRLVSEKENSYIEWPSEKRKDLDLSLLEYILIFGRGPLVKVSEDEKNILDALYE